MGDPAAVDGKGRPLVILLTPGQAAAAAGAVEGRPTLGRPRTTPCAVLADKAYSSRAIRAHLRSHGIVTVIPQPDDQKAHRKRRGSGGGRPVSYDTEAYRAASTSSSAPSTRSSTGADWPPATTSTQSSTAAPSSWPPHSSGPPTLKAS